jgi:DNA polymerase III sliding clamp (beta) subunit (PCNA family)
METMTENKWHTVAGEGESLNNLEVAGGLLLELLEGVSSHAGRDKSLPTLNAVEVEGGGGLLVARATDRYRLIEGGARALDGSLDKALISLEDTKRIITLLKAHKDHRIGLTRMGNALTVSALGDSLNLVLRDGTFPPTQELFTKSEAEPVGIEGVAFNPAFMADYAKIAGKGAAIKVYFTGEGKPMRVRITSDTINWRALLMPMRYTD